MKSRRPLRRRAAARFGRWPAVVLMLAAAACYPANRRLERHDVRGGYRYENLTATPATNTEKTFVILTFSGGGTRAAAFAYGVLEELGATDLGGGRTLLDEVDVISSVSGGSFTAAYFALVGSEEFFDTFPDAVLYRQLESGLILRLLAPWNWPKLLSPRYGRSDLADQYYGAKIFRRRTFGELAARRPFLILNATDIGRGAQFAFTQDHFDRLCSDLAPLAISRAVTASSAFPIAFTPLTLENHGWEACGYREPEWVTNAAEDLDVSPQLYDLAKTWRSYRDADRRPYVHLSDGGIADNIGLRAIEPAMLGLVAVDEQGETRGLDLNGKINRGEVERLVVIAVDAKPEAEPSSDRSARPPSIATVLNASATNPMENYSSDTVERFRALFDDWRDDSAAFAARQAGCDRLAAALCESRRDRSSCEEQTRSRCREEENATEMFRPPDPELYLIHVRFEQIPDEQAKQQLKGIATRLQLPKPEVDALVVWARRLLRESKPYGELIRALRAAPPAEPPR
jgi:NTE family protein